MTWTLKKVFIGLVIAAATFGAAFLAGNAITMTLGPGTSGLATIIITTVLVVIGARIVDRVGIFVLMVTFFTVCAIPTTLFGPPGPQKVIIGLLTGLTYDLVWLIFARRPKGLPYAALVATVVSVGLIYGLLVYLDHPRVEYMGSILKYLVPLYAALGWVGGWLGNWLFDTSLKHLSAVRQLAD